MKKKRFLPCPVEIVDAIEMFRIPGVSMQVLAVIIRQTYGWGKQSEVIPLSLLSKRTGLSKKTVCKNIKKLLALNLIIKKGSKTRPEYSVNEDVKTWIPSPKKVTNNNNKPSPNMVTTITQYGDSHHPIGGYVSPNWVTHPIIDTSLKDTLKDKDTLEYIPPTQKNELEVTNKKPNNHELIPYKKNKPSQNKDIAKFVNDYINYISNTFDKLAPKQTKTLFDNSYDAVDKLIRIDKLSFQYVYDVLLWSCRDEFWKDKVKSLAGLRKKKEDLTKFQKIATAFDKATHEYKPSQQLSNVGMRMMDKLQNY